MNPAQPTSHPVQTRPRWLRFSRTIAVAQGAVVLPQGRRVRAATPHLPDAAEPWVGDLAGERPIRLLVLGDSTAAGVGAPTQLEALPGQLARVLAARTGRGVAWRAVGRNGATSRDIIRDYLDAALAEPADLLFLSIGANDAMGMRSRAEFARDVRRILTAFSAHNPDALVLMSSLPVFGRFGLLPQPLRTSLYRHALALEAAGRAVVDGDARWSMTGHPPPYAEGFFAADRFHPSEIGYRDWADWAIDDVWGQGIERLAEAP